MTTFHKLSGLVVASALLTGCGLSADVARLKGWDAYREGKAAEAQKQFEYCTQKQVTDWKSHYYLGRIGLDMTNDPWYARRHLETCETIRKAQPDSMLAPEVAANKTAVPWPTRHEIADALAEAIHRQGHNARLLSYVREQATEFGECDDYMRMGRYMAKIGDNDAAGVAYVKATMLAEPADPRPHLELADFYDKSGDPEAALTELRKAYFIDPTIKGLAANIRAHGMVPGPTIAIAPERQKPEIVRRNKEEAGKPQYPGKDEPTEKKD